MWKTEFISSTRRTGTQLQQKLLLMAKDDNFGQHFSRNCCASFTTLSSARVSVPLHRQLWAVCMWSTQPTSSSAACCSAHFQTHPFILVCHKLYLSVFLRQIALENGPSVKKWKPNSSSSPALSNYCKPAVYTVSPFCQPKLCTPMRCCNRRVIVTCTRLPCPRADMQYKQWLTEHVGLCKVHTQFGSD